VQKIIIGYYVLCVCVLGYSGIIIKQIREADRIQLQIEDQIDPMFNGLMDKVYTGQVYPYDYESLKPVDLETLENITNIENSLE
jgi:hypothetical protein